MDGMQFLLLKLFQDIQVLKPSFFSFLCYLFFFSFFLTSFYKLYYVLFYNTVIYYHFHRIVIKISCLFYDEWVDDLVRHITHLSFHLILSHSFLYNYNISIPCPVTFYLISSFLISSNTSLLYKSTSFISFHLIFSNLILSYLILSYLILSYFIKHNINKNRHMCYSGWQK